MPLVKPIPQIGGTCCGDPEEKYFGRKRPGSKFWVYVAELSDEILHGAPKNSDRLPCVYVGVSAYKPQIRFCQHKRGYDYVKASPFMLRLLPCLYEDIEGVWGRDKGEELEKAVARGLHAQGYTVWSDGGRIRD